jgi:hypothetical protein
MGIVARALVVICAAALLGGCNIVVSKTPVFTAADGAGAPALKPGLWLAEKDDCKFDEAQPLAKWPDCADPLVITPTLVHGVGAKAGKPEPYLVAAGDPLVIQAQIDIDVSAGVDVSATGNATASGSASAQVKSPPPYAFLGVHPIALDAQGRVVRMEEWPVQCGPPPPDPKPNTPFDKARYVTYHPLPGLKIDGQVCTPSGKTAVLNAARESRTYGRTQTSHWVREGSE